MLLGIGQRSPQKLLIPHSLLPTSTVIKRGGFSPVLPLAKSQNFTSTPPIFGLFYPCGRKPYILTESLIQRGFRLRPQTTLYI
ncbi:MAG: hypothetical protein ACYTX0_38025 [Nostoc sp.]